MIPGNRLLIALATYNERDNLQPLVHEIHEVVPEACVLITDDRSPDGTGTVADDLAQRDTRIQVIHRPAKLGLGSAYLGAIAHAEARCYQLLVTMDADHSHSPTYLPALLAGMEKHDIMIGSRYVAGGGVENWPVSRQMMSWLTNVAVDVMLGIPARDTSGGYRCYRVDILRRADLSGFLSSGYSFQQEILYRCLLAGARIGETPIVFTDRKAGQSKAGLAEVSRSLTALARLGLQARKMRISADRQLSAG